MHLVYHIHCCLKCVNYYNRIHSSESLLPSDSSSNIRNIKSSFDVSLLYLFGYRNTWYIMFITLGFWTAKINSQINSFTLLFCKPIRQNYNDKLTTFEAAVEWIQCMILFVIIFITITKHNWKQSIQKRSIEEIQQFYVVNFWTPVIFFGRVF